MKKLDQPTVNQSTKTFTYQARIMGERPVLDAFAQLFGRVERKLYVDLVHGDKPLSQLKKDYLKKFNITARQFNSIKIEVEGMIASTLELLKLSVSDYEQKIKKKYSQLKKLTEKRSKEVEFLTENNIPENRRLKAQKAIERIDFSLHQGKRRLKTLQDRLLGIQKRIDEQNPKLCFGSKKLFRSQFHLDKSSQDYQKDFDQWKADWELARNHNIYLVGSKDETAGNQTCQGVLQEDGSINLTIRLPDALHAQFGRVFTTNVKLNYGHEEVAAALNSSRVETIKSTDENGLEVITKKRTGVALTYRFSKDKKGWRVFISVPVTQQFNSIKQSGVIGIDLNADHLAVTELDRFGNLIAFKRFDLNLNHKSSDQRQAIIGDTAKAISQWAAQAQKPIVMEKLDFKKKKAELSDSQDEKYNRMLSSLAYNQIHQMISAAAFRRSVEIITVNPAYTSLIGNINYSKRLGISTHLSAAMAIGRRSMNFSENPVIDQAGQFTYLTRDGIHVTLTLPERNRDKHVWSLWSRINTKIKQPRLEGYRRSRDRARKQREESKYQKAVLDEISLLACHQADIWS